MPKVYLSFEGVVLLTEILLPVMVRVSPPVTPLECLMSGNVYVLEIVVRPIAALSGYGQGAGGGLRTGVGGDTDQ